MVKVISLAKHSIKNCRRGKYCRKETHFPRTTWTQQGHENYLIQKFRLVEMYPRVPSKSENPIACASYGEGASAIFSEQAINKYYAASVKNNTSDRATDWITKLPCRSFGWMLSKAKSLAWKASTESTLGCSIFLQNECRSKILIKTCIKQIYKDSFENSSLQEYKTGANWMQHYILVLFDIHRSLSLILPGVYR